TYAYTCTACEHSFEIVQSFTDDSLTRCPECEGRLRKLFNAVGVVFKGSGFYSNDSRRDSRSGKGSGRSTRSGSGAGAGGEAPSSESGGSSSSDSSPSGSSPSASSASSDSSPSAEGTKSAKKPVSRSEGSAA
ncbi:MAG: FmdB family zinc ribbon protein, partial [Dermatophilaceae bacterium]